jgi:hypothetical protein
MVTSGGTWNAFEGGFDGRLPSTRSAIFTSPFRARSMALATRSARRSSSSSRSKARESTMVSSAMPSVVVKTWASTMLPPAAAQAPVTMASRRGWSGDRTVSSVTP